MKKHEDLIDSSHLLCIERKKLSGRYVWKIQNKAIYGS